MSNLVIGKRSFPVLLDKDGIEQVRLRDMCEPFGLSLASQGERLKHVGWAKVSTIEIIRTNGKRYPTPCIPLRRVPMFFATLEPSRVNKACRGELEMMQNEAADAVAAYYIDGAAIRATALPEQLARARDFIDALFRKEPATDPTWPAEFVRLYESWNGRAWREGDPQPYSMQSANWFFYQMIFPPEVLSVIKTKGLEEGCRYHQVLTDEPRDYLRRCLDQATKLAGQCASETEWRRRMRHWYGKTREAIAGQSALAL